MRLTRRFIVKSLNNLSLSDSIRYERYYIDDSLRIQKKDNILEKEILDDKDVIHKSVILEDEFLGLKAKAKMKIVRDSYLYLKDKRISIKKYYGIYQGLNRVEIKFSTKEEMQNYKKEPWMGEEITFSPLAFDKDLCKLSKEEFLDELNNYL